MAFSKFVTDLDSLPIFYPSMSSPVFGIERGGIVLFEPWYDLVHPCFEFFEEVLKKAGCVPAVDGVAPGDLLGEIVVKLSEVGIRISWPVLVVVTLFVFKFKGWLIRGVTRTVTDGVAVGSPGRIVERDVGGEE